MQSQGTLRLDAELLRLGITYSFDPEKLPPKNAWGRCPYGFTCESAKATALVETLRHA